MKRILSFLSMIFLLTLPVAGMLNNNDLIWEGTAAGFGANMKAKYKESPENGLIDQTLEVELQNAPRNTQVLVTAGGYRLGTLTTDNTGRGIFRVDILGQQPDGNGRVNGPRLETGDIVRLSVGGSGLNAVLNPVP
mgnify:CR=1 FL=1